MKEAIRNMLAAFHIGNDSDTRDKTSLKDPHVVRGVCESLTNAGNYRSVIMENIRTKLGVNSSRKNNTNYVSKKGEMNGKI